MTVVITKKLSSKEVKEVLNKLVEKKPKKSLRKHFGVSNEIIDAIEFQKKSRNEWC